MMIERQRNLSPDALCRKKKELEEMRQVLYESVGTNCSDYQEVLAASRRLDKVIVEYMKLVNTKLQ